MEREIEVKVLRVEEKDVKERLKAIGAQYVGEEKQINYRIDSSAIPLDPLDHLRLRVVYVNRELVKKEFTYKKRRKIEKARAYDEYTVNIDDEENLFEILKHMAYDQVEEMGKVRRSYVYKDCRIEFDRWDSHILSYPYMEIEAPSSERIYEIVDLLGLDKSKVTDKSIAQLREEEKIN